MFGDGVGEQQKQTQKRLFEQERRVQHNGRARNRYELHHHVDPTRQGRPRPSDTGAAATPRARPVVATVDSNAADVQTSSSQVVVELRQLVHHKLDRLLTMAVVVGPSVSSVAKQRALETGAGGRQIYSLAVSAKQLLADARGFTTGQ